jgi:hypothetical protein
MELGGTVVIDRVERNTPTGRSLVVYLNYPDGSPVLDANDEPWPHDSCYVFTKFDCDQWVS